MIRSVSHGSQSNKDSISKISGETLKRYLKRKNNKDTNSLIDLKKRLFKNANSKLRNCQNFNDPKNDIVYDQLFPKKELHLGLKGKQLKKDLLKEKSKILMDLTRFDGVK